MAVKHLVENVRDIALVGHRAAGKTTLADALLFEAKAVDRLGSVDDGTSVSDSTTRNTSTTSPSTRTSSTSTTTASTSTSSTPPATPTSSAPPSRRSTPSRPRSSSSRPSTASRSTPAACSTRPSKHGLSRAIVINKLDADNVDFADAGRRPSRRRSARTACCSTSRTRVGPDFKRRRQRARPAGEDPRRLPGRPRPRPARSSSTPSSRPTRR